MKVRLFSYTQIDEDFKQETLSELRKKWWAEEKDSGHFIAPEFSTVQDLVAFCARVSNPNNQVNEQTSTKLLKYLIKHKHWSPLEMVDAVLEIDTTRDIAHQIIRHRSFAFQEFSQRYANVEELNDMFEYSEARLQDYTNRQNSIETDDVELQAWWDAKQKWIAEQALSVYLEAINKKGMAKEQARKVLPEGLTKTRLYMKGSLRSWIHYCDLRGANGTQKEHMEIAHACAEVISKIFPLINEINND